MVNSVTPAHSLNAFTPFDILNRCHADVSAFSVRKIELVKCYYFIIPFVNASSFVLLTEGGVFLRVSIECKTF